MLVNIKVLFAVLMVSAFAVIGVTVAVFIRVRWQLKSQQAQAKREAELTPENSPESAL